MKKVKKQKHPKLPNGYGSIRWLGGNRRNPYAVHPPGHVKSNGVTKTPTALCYVDDWYKGFAVLTAYKAGTYTPGMERELGDINKRDTDEFIHRILADYNVSQGIKENEETLTFSEVYEQFYDWKYNQDKSRTYSKSAMNATKAAFKNCSELHNKAFIELKHQDLQDVIDNCTLKYASKEHIVTLFHQIYAYADIYELCEKDYSAHVKIKTADDDEHGVPFTDTNLEILWKHKNNPTVEFILIMCYSGYRIKAYSTIEVNLEKKYFKGGVKTAASKDRIVPIHSSILPLVKDRMKRDGAMLKCSQSIFRNEMYDALAKLGIKRHTPHDCRHTFSVLCEKYGVKENDRKRMLGHSFGADITNKVYGHRNLEELRKEIEKIIVTNV